MESQTVDQLQEHFLSKLDNLNKCMQMSNICKEQDVQDTLMSINSELLILESTVAQMKSCLQSQNQQLSEAKILSEELTTQNAMLQHMSDNMPSRLPGLQTMQAERKPSVVLQPNYEANKKPERENVKKPSSKGSNKTFAPVMDYVTIEEYNSVPKYMKGRLPYETVNSVVESFNRTLQAKYSFLKQPSTSLNNKDKKKYKKYKSQETKDTKGVFFCIEEDLKDLGNLRVDSNVRSSLTILRHCGRMREIRGNGIIRYCIV